MRDLDSLVAATFVQWGECGVSRRPPQIAMTLPRPVFPGRFYMINRRCTQRQFLLRPDDVTNEAFMYCLAEAAQRFGMEVLLPSAMSNHYHNVVYDRFGIIPEFTEHFHKMLAKCMNCVRGRAENFWSTEQVCDVELIELGDVINKLVYAATNPVKDGLVERVHHWPGVNGLSALLNARAIHAKRPKHFFAEDGVMPEHVTLNLVIPEELGDRDLILQAVRERVAEVEALTAAERARTGAGVLGRRGVLRQSWRDAPKTIAPRGNLRPTIAARSKWARIEAIQRNREFQRAYREARNALLAGKVPAFPPGTYWLKRFANVPIAAAPST